MLIYFLALKLNKVLLEIKYAKTKTISHNFDVKRVHCSSLLSLALPAIAIAFRSLSLACALYANELWSSERELERFSAVVVARWRCAGVRERVSVQRSACVQKYACSPFSCLLTAVTDSRKFCPNSDSSDSNAKRKTFAFQTHITKTKQQNKIAATKINCSNVTVTAAFAPTDKTPARPPAHFSRPPSSSPPSRR